MGRNSEKGFGMQGGLGRVRRILLVLILGSQIMASSGAMAAEDWLPEFYGIYAVAGKQYLGVDVPVSTMEPSSVSVRVGRRTAVAEILDGSDPATSSLAEVIVLPSHTQFLVYAANSGIISVMTIAQELKLGRLAYVRNATVDTGWPQHIRRTAAENAWDSGSPTELFSMGSASLMKSVSLLLKPVSDRSDMVLAVPSAPLEPGLYALRAQSAPGKKPTVLRFAVEPLTDGERALCVDVTYKYSIALSSAASTPCGETAALPPGEMTGHPVPEAEPEVPEDEAGASRPRGPNTVWESPPVLRFAPDPSLKNPPEPDPRLQDLGYSVLLRGKLFSAKSDVCRDDTQVRLFQDSLGEQVQAPEQIRDLLAASWTFENVVRSPGLAGQAGKLRSVVDTLKDMRDYEIAQDLLVQSMVKVVAAAASGGGSLGKDAIGLTWAVLKKRLLEPKALLMALAQAGLESSAAKYEEVSGWAPPSDAGTVDATTLERVYSLYVEASALETAYLPLASGLMPKRWTELVFDQMLQSAAKGMLGALPSDSEILTLKIIGGVQFDLANAVQDIEPIEGFSEALQLAGQLASIREKTIARWALKVGCERVRTQGIDSQDYAPIGPGFKWRYAVFVVRKNGTQSGKVSLQVKDKTVIKGREYYETSMRTRGFGGMRERVEQNFTRVDGSGVFRIAGDDKRQQEFTDLVFPLKVGARWTAKEPDKDIAYEVEAFGALDLGDDRYENVVKIRGVVNPGRKEVPGEFYFAPGIGLLAAIAKHRGGRVEQYLERYDGSPSGRMTGATADAGTSTISEMKMIVAAIEAYARTANEYPPGPRRALEQLRPLLEPRYIKRLPVEDAWGNPYLYVGNEPGGDYAIISTGSDGVEDADYGLIGDISSCTLRSGRGFCRGRTTDSRSDIINTNGIFVQYPAHANP